MLIMLRRTANVIKYIILSVPAVIVSIIYLRNSKKSKRDRRFKKYCELNTNADCQKPFYQKILQNSSFRVNDINKVLEEM